ncbi:CinA family protein [Psychrosphaera aestuarii]|uniref:CinA family protein n=1 Tax=Psychrosphaera aestuarii TaxID=1266052 RepID=UPI001B325F95|nr:nicotinamide-nucleotide amidohydrolase family protein [Psychrosphaera aestuarii]
MNGFTNARRLLAEHLLENGWTITTAESCTAGGVSSAITDLAGSSAYFNEAYVTYSNEAKHRLLGVSRNTLDTYGAVSEETVAEMATGALKAADANIAIAVSGIAGPGGGTESKPVGTVWFAFAVSVTKNNKEITVYTHRQQFDGDRLAVRNKAVQFSLNQLVTILL